MHRRTLALSRPLEIMSYDIDVMGIVSNIVYVRWFEDLRYHWVNSHWSVSRMLDSGHSPILSNTTVQYQRPLTISDRPNGHVWIDEMTRSRWTISFEITTERGVHCTGKQLGYFVDNVRKRPVPIPGELRSVVDDAFETTANSRE